MYITPITANRNQRQISFTQGPTQLADDTRRLIKLLVNAKVSDNYGNQSPRFTEDFISSAIDANLGSNILKLLTEATFMDDQMIPKFLFEPVDIMYFIKGISTDYFGERICRNQKEIEYYTQIIKNAIEIALNNKTTSRDEKVKLIKRLYEELPCNWARIVKEMNIQENEHELPF